MKKFKEIYEKNIKLDNCYKEMYKDTEYYREKNLLSFLVEIGEMANEIRCFKYWPLRRPIDREKILEEYIDVLTFSFIFCEEVNMDIETALKNVEVIEDPTFIILKIFELANNIKDNNSKDNMETFFSYMMMLAENLNYTREEILEEYYKKLRINYERLGIEYDSIK